MGDLYAVPFWDVSMPSFVSAYINYFGTMKDISDFAANCHKSDSHKEFQRGYDELLNGSVNATVNIAYCDLPIAERVILLDSNEELVSNIQWKMLNTWGFVYLFRADAMRRELIWIKHDSNYVRAAKYTVKGLRFGSESRSHTISDRWGNEEVITIDKDNDHECRSLFYFLERFFDTEEECRADMTTPRFEPSADLRTFCFEFIGDG